MADQGSCVFCRIAERAAPASVVCEDDRTLAFMDIAPAAEGHTLVIPKRHFETLYDMDEDAAAAVAATARRVALAIRAAVKPDGLGVFQLNGRAAGQTVFHVHMHLIPRWAGQAPRVHGRVSRSQTALRDVALAIARHLGGS